MEIDNSQQQRRSSRRQANEQHRQERMARRESQRQDQMEIVNEENQPEPNEQDINVNGNVPQDEQIQEENQQEIPQQINNAQEEIHNPMNPMLREQQNQLIVKVSPSLFSTKIPNIDSLRDFFIHQCKRYCPTVRDMTTSFAKDVLSGKKKLLKLKEVLWVTNVPRYKEICSKAIWNEAKSANGITIYMPDFPESRLPQKAYLLNVMNTIRPNSVIKYIQELTKKRRLIEIEESQILMTAEFSQLLNSFNSIMSNKKQQRLNGLRTIPESDNCSICFSAMRTTNVKKWFQCKRHKGHKRCVTAYYQNRQDDQYFCPFRCQQAEGE